MRARIGRQAIFTTVLLALSGQLWAADILRFPPGDEQALLGHFTYEIPRHGWTSKLRQPLRSTKRYALEYRENRPQGYRVVFLVKILQRQAKDCGNRYEYCTDQIVAALKLPEIATKEFTFLRCNAKGKPGGDDTAAYLGIIQESKVGGVFTPRLAWRVNLDRLSFDPIDGNAVECPAAGVDR